MIRRLRKISLERRIKIFYLLLCVVPVVMLLMIAGASGQYQQQRSHQNFELSYLEQLAKQINIQLSRYEQKAADAAENNDLQADVMLYTQNEAYRNDVVYERIRQILDNLCQEELFFDYAVLKVGDAVSFSSGKDARETGGEKYPEWEQYNNVDWFSDTDGNIYYEKQFRIGMYGTQDAVLLIKCNTSQLERICSEMIKGSAQHLLTLTADSKILYTNDSGRNPGVQWKQMELLNGWKLYLGDTLPVSTHFIGIMILLSLLFLAGAAVGIHILRNSLILPLTTISRKLQQIGKESLAQNSIAVEEEKYAPGNRDEHVLLEQELNHMLRRQKELTEAIYVRGIQEEKLQMKIKELELNAMQQQVNPHFLLNILNTIYWMAEEKGYIQTAEMIATLGEYFRLCVSTSDRYVRITEEIENAKSYLKILAILHEASFQVEWHIEPEVLTYYTVRLILQPLIENAYEHGLKRKKEGGILRISCEKITTGIRFVVQDNGCGMTTQELEELTEYLNDGSYEARKSIGTKNVNMRIQMYFGEGYGLTFESQKDAGTTAVIKIPFIEKGGRSDV